MKIPKMKTRPTSQQSCASFGGVLHSPTAPVGTWYDCRNLSSDYSPTVTPTLSRSYLGNVDGNTVSNAIIAMCGGEKIVLLDNLGYLWCGGNYVDVSAVLGMRYRWETHYPYMSTLDPDNPGVPYCSFAGKPTDGWDTDGRTFSGSLETRKRTIHSFQLRVSDWSHPEDVYWEETHTAAGGTVGTPTRTRTEFLTSSTAWPGFTFYGWKFLDYGFNFYTRRTDLPDYSEVTITTYSEPYYSEYNAKLIRMGANVLVIPTASGNSSAMWVNVVRLSSLNTDHGETMIFGTDYGWLDYKSHHAGALDNLTTLSLCDVDGKVYSTATVSSTEPVDLTKPWLDISTNPPSLRQYAAYSSAWVAIPRTFIKISPVQLTDPNGSKIKVGDTIHIKASYFPDFTQPYVQSVLEDTDHYIETVVEADNAIVVPGLMGSITETTTAVYDIERPFPKLDFYVECGNRIWGCKYDEEKTVNEIYASKLGDASNWASFQGLSTDSWRASRGGAAKYTGAAVLDNHPLFFREDSVEKVFPSSAGAHQVQRVDLDGVEEGAENSLCVIQGRLYYKSRGGIMVYDGTLPRSISSNFGDMVFRGGSGARHHAKYCLSTSLFDPSQQSGGGGDRALTRDAELPNPWTPVVLVYDTERGDWHIETQSWTGIAVTFKDVLYYTDNGLLCTMEGVPGYYEDWWAETAPQAIRYSDGFARSLTEHKWISYFRIRFRAYTDATGGVYQADLPEKSAPANTIQLYVSYNDMPWELKKTIAIVQYEGLRTIEVNFLPRRMDNFRIRLEGSGPVQIFDMAWRVERSEAGH